jgi:hypothetical protein
LLIFLSREIAEMIRNQMLDDPESSPQKESVFNFGNHGNDSSPWFTGGGGNDQGSPTHSGGGMYNQQQSNSFNSGGVMSGTSLSFGNSNDDYENEPPLLEELGINFEHMEK